jgi:RimJ/RimL family protein N-acetyltransferase
MIECPVNQPGLPSLFDPHVPNNPALWAVFQGRHAGRALVDDLRYPSQCLVRTEAVLTYASHLMSHSFLSEAIDYFRHTGHNWLIRSPGDPPASESHRTLPRLEFFDYDPHSPVLEDFRNRLPADFEIRPIDANLLNRCEWRDDMAFYCGSLENFLHHGVGICLMHGDEIIVETYASALGAPYAEIGAIAHEPYRGNGYAPIAVSYLIEALEQRGLHAYWSCNTDNPASARVARKLGFKIERPYEIWEYESLPGT